MLMVSELSTCEDKFHTNNVIIKTYRKFLVNRREETPTISIISSQANTRTEIEKKKNIGVIYQTLIYTNIKW